MDIAKKIIEGYKMTSDDVLELVNKLSLDEICQIADTVRTHFLGKDVDSCSILNAKSGRCSENCKWCAQSAHYSTGCTVYDYVSPEVSLENAKHSAKKGIRRFSLVTSGRTISDADINKMCDSFNLIRESVDIELCGSFGLLNKSQFDKLYQAGMRRFHCNLETAPSFFPTLCTTHTIEDKIESINAARQAGMTICSGGIIGLGESFEQRVELALTLDSINVDSIPINILQPIKGTPLENVKPLTTDEILLSFAVFRLINPKVHIRFAGGRLAIKDVQEKALKSGVSAILMGDMLTTVGSQIDDDFKMLTRLGYEY